MQRSVRFAPGGVPGWDAVCGQLARVGVVVSVKMIDGLPAFPDEVPEPGWKELRVGTPGGMVTLRSAPDAVTCVVWGNADDRLRADWDTLCWACAAAGGGQVETPDGLTSADAFARSVGLKPA
ncbi:hypothetical protein [Urbifossiella limnaea]|nr:hypothetical protein [Urbifossiella limnaea]